MTEARRPCGAARPEPVDHTDALEAPHLDQEEPDARPAGEADEGEQADRDLSIVDVGDLGGGNALDAAELARRDPIDGKR